MTHPSQREEANDHFSDHRRVDDNLEDEKREAGTPVLEAEHDRGDRERRHGQIEHDVRSGVHKPVRDAPRYLPSGEGIDGAQGPVREGVQDGTR